MWLLRQGDSYGSGVAAAALAQYDTREQVAFLAAVAAMPAVSLLWSPHQYGQVSLFWDVGRETGGGCWATAGERCRVKKSRSCAAHEPAKHPPPAPTPTPTLSLVTPLQHSAARLLAALARAAPAMAEALVEAGAVRGLLQQLDLR